MSTLAILQERLGLEPATFDEVAPATAVDLTRELAQRIPVNQRAA